MISTKPVQILAIMACTVPWSSTTLNPQQALATIARHDRAIHLHDTWVRDPYIILGPDGYYYYTGTTQMPEQERTADATHNTGLGPKSLVGWQVRVWRSRDLVAWESLGSPYTLKDGTWYQTEGSLFAEVPQEQWRIWAPELHFIDGRWAVIHTTPQPLAPRVGAALSFSSGREVRAPGPIPWARGSAGVTIPRCSTIATAPGG